MTLLAAALPALALGAFPSLLVSLLAHGYQNDRMAFLFDVGVLFYSRRTEPAARASVSK